MTPFRRMEAKTTVLCQSQAPKDGKEGKEIRWTRLEYREPSFYLGPTTNPDNVNNVRLNFPVRTEPLAASRRDSNTR